ncbi:MAG TPA: PAS domain S-box protein, partial [Actinomycetota bacterium]
MSAGSNEAGTSAEAAARWVGLGIEPGSLLEATPECLVVARRDGQILYANSAAAALTGFTKVELAGKHVEMLVASHITDATDGERRESVCRTAAGGSLPVEVHVGVIEGEEELLVVTLRDVTELQAGREAVYEAEAKYRSLVEHIPAVVYLDPVDEDARSIYVSPQVDDLLGISPREWMEDWYAWRRHVHPEDLDRAWEEYQEAYEAHAPLNHE